MEADFKADFNIESFFNNPQWKRFYFPGQIIWGSECLLNLPNALKNKNKILLFVDQFFTQDKYIIDLQNALSSRLIGSILIKNEPKTREIEAVINDYSKKSDCVLAIGGGSTLDFAKCFIVNEISGHYNGVGYGSLKNISFDLTQKPEFITLPTTAGTGAECSRIYVAYDTADKHKVMGRTWRSVADKVFLDPYFLSKTQSHQLVLFAFDAFLHYFESLVCKYESSQINNMLSYFGISELLQSVHHIVEEKQQNPDWFSRLQVSSTFAGIAISNVRTGHIHEAAGALLEHTQLSHPETLFVFYEAFIKQYLHEIKDKEQILINIINAFGFKHTLKGINDIIQWWNVLFSELEIKNKIKLNLQQIPKGQLPMVIQSIENRVLNDKVWTQKECPIQIDKEKLKSAIIESFGQFDIKL